MARRRQTDIISKAMPVILKASEDISRTIGKANPNFDKDGFTMALQGVAMKYARGEYDEVTAAFEDAAPKYNMAADTIVLAYHKFHEGPKHQKTALKLLASAMAMDGIEELVATFHSMNDEGYQAQFGGEEEELPTENAEGEDDIEIIEDDPVMPDDSEDDSMDDSSDDLVGEDDDSSAGDEEGDDVDDTISSIIGEGEMDDSGDDVEIVDDETEMPDESDEEMDEEESDDIIGEDEPEAEVESGGQSSMAKTLRLVQSCVTKPKAKGKVIKKQVPVSKANRLTVQAKERILANKLALAKVMRSR